MSALAGTRGWLFDSTTDAAYSGYTFQINPTLSISKSVGGKTLTMTARSDLGTGWGSFLWGADEFIIGSSTKGQALQWSYNIVRGGPIDGPTFTTFTGLDYSLVPQGNRLNPSTDFCGANGYLRGKNAAGDGCTTVTQPALWADPTDVIAPLTHTICALGGFTTRSDAQIGYLGDDNIVWFQNTITYPTDHPELDFYGYDWALECEVTWYLRRATGFTVCHNCNLDTGALTLDTPTLAGGLIQNQTKCYIWSNPGDTLAAAIYSPPSQVGPYGFYGTRTNDSTYSNCFHFRGPSTRQKTGSAVKFGAAIFTDNTTSGGGGSARAAAAMRASGLKVSNP